MLLKEEGGLGLANIQQRDIALKIQWILKILENPKMENLANELIGNPIGKLLWSCTLDPQDVNQVFPKAPEFWKHVMHGWFNTTMHEPTNKQEIKDQIIWFNSNLQIGNKPTFNRKLYKEGLIKIQDILDDSDDLLSFTEFGEKFKTKDYVFYYGLKNAIPWYWKEMLKVEG